jgi:hypothetical protein
MPGETMHPIPTAAPEPTQPFVIPKPSVPPGFAHLLSRETWVKFFVLAVPIIFTAGALYVSVKTMTDRQDEQERALQVEKDRGAKMESDARVMSQKVDVIGAQQDRLVTKVEVIDNKLNAASIQLGAISERVGARPAQRDDPGTPPSQ